MDDTELMSVAKELNIENASVDDRAGLIYEILDKQAIVGSANSKKQSGETSAKKGRSRITVKKEANKVYTASKGTAEKIPEGLADVKTVIVPAQEKPAPTEEEPAAQTNDSSKPQEEPQANNKKIAATIPILNNTPLFFIIIQLKINIPYKL